MSNKIVLDASALLCLLNDEPGAERVAEILPRSLIGAANYAEVVSKQRERGLSLDEVKRPWAGYTLTFAFIAIAGYVDWRPAPCNTAIWPFVGRPSMPRFGYRSRGGNLYD